MPDSGVAPSSSRRILLCHDSYADAGGESAVFENEVAGLRRQGHQVSVYQRDNREIDAMTWPERVALVPAAFHSGRASRGIADLIAAERPDVAIVQNVFPLISPSVYGALRSRSVPVIQAVYNYRFICPDAHLYSRGEICERCVGGNHLHAVARRCVRDSVVLSGWYAAVLWAHRRLGTFVNNIDRFMVPDRFLADKLVEGGLPADRMRVNVNPLFVRDLEPHYAHSGYVLYIGRLIEQKGVLTLMEAMRHTRGGLRLRIVGLGRLDDRIRALCRSSDLCGKVEFLGARWGDEARAHMAAAAAIVVPSEWYDNLPQSICQANALGKPVIASRINGIPEYVRDGDNGYLFKPGDPTLLAAAIDRIAALSTEQYTAFSRRARAVAERDFDYATHHRVLMSIVAELVPERRADAV